MRRAVVVLLGIMLISLFGCGQRKFKLELDGYGLSSKRSAYAEGTTVKVTYDVIATDTDYSFYLDCDDIELDRDFVNGAYVMSFKMPAHDVKLTAASRNSMMNVADAVITLENRVETADIWIMADTPENRGQSVWGGTALKAFDANEPCEIILEEISADDLYIIRMIDENKLYYEACSVEITDSQSVVIRSQENGSGTLVCVYDAGGDPVNEYEMFSAAL